MKQKRILVVDDMRKVYEKIEALLKGVYDSDYARNEKEALEMITTTEYDKVITDYHLGSDSPKGGLDVIRSAKDKGLQVILMSTENHEQEALETGADKFIFKKRLFNDIKLID